MYTWAGHGIAVPLEDLDAIPSGVTPEEAEQEHKVDLFIQR
jgi:hypothetical protein